MRSSILSEAAELEAFGIDGELRTVDLGTVNLNGALDLARERRSHAHEVYEYGEDCLAATRTRDSPWYVVPAADTENGRLIVSRILVETLEKLELAYPTVDAAHLRRLQEFRKQLT